MALLGMVGAIALVTVAFLWATIRTTLYWLQSGNDTVTGVYQRLWQAYALSLTMVFVVEVWPGLSHWLSTVLGCDLVPWL